MDKNTNNLIRRTKNQAATPDNNCPCQWSLQIKPQYKTQPTC